MGKAWKSNVQEARSYRGNQVTTLRDAQDGDTRNGAQALKQRQAWLT